MPPKDSSMLDKSTEPADLADFGSFADQQGDVAAEATLAKISTPDAAVVLNTTDLAKSPVSDIDRQTPLAPRAKGNLKRFKERGRKPGKRGEHLDVKPDEVPKPGAAALIAALKAARSESGAAAPTETITRDADPKSPDTGAAAAPAPPAMPATPEPVKVEMKLPGDGEIYEFVGKDGRKFFVEFVKGPFEAYLVFDNAEQQGVPINRTKAELEQWMAIGEWTWVGKREPKPAGTTGPDSSKDAALATALAGGAAAAVATAGAPPAMPAAPASPEPVAPRGPEAPATPERPKRTLAEVEQALLALKGDPRTPKVPGELEIARKDYIRIEAEQKRSLEKVKRVFRNLFGAKEVNDEVRLAKESYEQKLQELENLEKERIGLAGFKGDVALRQVLAEVIEYRLNEATRFDDDRREQRLGAAAVPLKEKWAAVGDRYRRNYAAGGTLKTSAMLGGAFFDALGTTLYRGAKNTVRLYSENTKTLKGKAVAATLGFGLAGALTFTSGGAALAIGGCLLLKQAVQGGAAGVGTKATLDAAAQWNRQRMIKNAAAEGASNVIAANRREAVKEYAGRVGGKRPDLKNLAISKEGLEEMEKLFKRETNWRKQAARRELWRQSRFFAAATLGIGLAGMGNWGHVGEYLQKIGIDFGGSVTGEQVRGVADRLTGGAAGAMGPAAEVTTPPASAASGAARAAAEGASAPGVVASAVESGGVVPAPSGAASTPTGTESPPPASTNGEPGSSATPPNEPPKPTGTEASGEEGAVRPGETRTEVTPTGGDRQAAITKLLGERTIAAKETIGGYAVATAGEMGITDLAAQKRFAAGLAKLVNERLAEASDEIAQKAGFIETRTGGYSADLIPANGQLNLSLLVSSDDIDKLIAQHMSGETPPAPSIVDMPPAGVPDEEIAAATDGAAPEGRVDTGRVADAAREAVAPSDGVASTLSQTAEAPVDLKLARVISGDRSAIIGYVRDLPRIEQQKLFHITQNTLDSLFDPDGPSRVRPLPLEEVERYTAFTQVPMKSVLEYGDLPDEDLSVDGLGSKRVEAIADLAQSAARQLGRDIARPKLNENVAVYVLRMATMAQARGVKLAGMVN